MAANPGLLYQLSTAEPDAPELDLSWLEPARSRAGMAARPGKRGLTLDEISAADCALAGAEAPDDTASSASARRTNHATIGFGAMRLKYALETEPHRREENHSYFDEAARSGAGRGTFTQHTAEALVILLATAMPTRDRRS